MKSISNLECNVLIIICYRMHGAMVCSINIKWPKHLCLGHALTHVDPLKLIENSLAPTNLLQHGTKWLDLWENPLITWHKHQ